MEMMVEAQELPQPTRLEELPAASQGASTGGVADTAQPPAGTPLYFPDEPESSGRWLGALLVLIILFYFFAPVGWKAWVQEQWEKLPVEVSVKVKKLPTTTVTPPPPPPAGGLPPLHEIPAPSPE